MWTSQRYSTAPRSFRGDLGEIDDAGVAGILRGDLAVGLARHDLVRARGPELVTIGERLPATCDKMGQHERNLRYSEVGSTNLGDCVSTDNTVRVWQGPKPDPCNVAAISAVQGSCQKIFLRSTLRPGSRGVVKVSDRP